jgi:hypothetical protein
VSKSLFEYIAEEIDKALPPDSPITGREIYLRGFERYQREGAARQLARERRELEQSYPLLAPAQDDDWTVEPT